jgi:uncharacterized protein YggE
MRPPILETAITIGFLAALATPSQAQEVQVNRTNKTIEITATHTAKADADAASIVFGYENYGPTREQVVEESTRMAAIITKALTDAGVPKDALETQEIKLSRRNVEFGPVSNEAKAYEYQAHQSWLVHVPAADAHTVADLALAAGANELGDITWGLRNPEALEAEAYAAALEKARAMAERIARGLHRNVGELLYVSNSQQEYSLLFRIPHGVAGGISPVAAKRAMPTVVLFPQKIERQVTVHAVFALE